MTVRLGASTAPPTPAAEGLPKVADAGLVYQPAFTPARWTHPFLWETVGFLSADTIPDLIRRGGQPNTQFSPDAAQAAQNVAVTIITGPFVYPGFKQLAGQSRALACFPVTGLLAADEWVIEGVLRIDGADLADVSLLEILNVYGGVQQSLSVVKASGFLQATLNRDTANNIEGGSNASATAQFAISSGDVPADTWKTFYVSFDGTNLRLGLGADTKTATATVGANIKPRVWATGRPGSSLVVMGGSQGGGVSPQALSLGPVAIRRYARNGGNGQVAVRKNPPRLVVNADSNAGTYVFQPGVVDHHIGWRGTGLDTEPAKAAKQIAIVQAAGCARSVRHAEFDQLAVPSMSGGPAGTITSIDFTLLDTAYDRYAASDIHLSIFRTPAALRSGGTNIDPPSSWSVYAEYVSQVIAHIKARYPGKLKTLTWWNEPAAAGFWSGTRAQLKTGWLVVAQRLYADDPTLPLGNIDAIPRIEADSGSDEYHTIKEIIDLAQANGLPMPHVGLHLYNNDLTAIEELTASILAYGAAHGFSGMKVLCSEWSVGSAFANAEQQQEYSQSSMARWFYTVRAGASAFQQLAYMAGRPSEYLASHFFGFSHDPDWIGYGMVDDGADPRPMHPLVAHQVIAKHVAGDTLLTSPGTWPGLRTLATKRGDGTIVVSYGLMRLWDPDKTTDFHLQFDGTLPSAFRWKRWHHDATFGADPRLHLVESGDQDDLPLGVTLNGYSFGCIEITP